MNGVVKPGAVPKADCTVVKTGSIPKAVDTVVKAGADGAVVKAGGIVIALEEAPGIKFSFFCLAGHLGFRATKRY